MKELRGCIQFLYRRSAPVACLVVALALTAMPIVLAPATASSDPSRIVSIGGAVTEILYALGRDKNIVAVDSTSLYPPSAMKEKPNVGYMRQLSPEGVLGLAPTMMLAIEGAGPKEAMSVLAAAKVPLVVVPDRFSGEGIIEKVRIVAQAVGDTGRGQCIVDQVQADLAVLRDIEAGIGKQKRVLFVLSFVDGRAMVSGRKTAADGIIRMAGAENAIAEYDGYKPISDEAVVAARPDVVLVMERSSGNNLSAEAVFAHPAFSATLAAAHRAFVSMEGLYLLGFGPRSVRAARDLAMALYPGLKAELLPSERTPLAKACQEQ